MVARADGSGLRELATATISSTGPRPATACWRTTTSTDDPRCRSSRPTAAASGRSSPRASRRRAGRRGARRAERGESHRAPTGADVATWGCTRSIPMGPACARSARSPRPSRMRRSSSSRARGYRRTGPSWPTRTGSRARLGSWTDTSTSGISPAGRTDASRCGRSRRQRSHPCSPRMATRWRSRRNRRQRS